MAVKISQRYSAWSSSDVAVAEPEVLEAAQIVGAAERSLKIERDLGPGVGLGRRDERVQRQDSPVTQQRDVLLQVDFDAVEREPVRRCCRRTADTSARSGRRDEDCRAADAC